MTAQQLLIMLSNMDSEKINIKINDKEYNIAGFEIQSGKISILCGEEI